MDADFEYEVYLGQWINWSRGPVLGATLTMTRTNGNLLIAFLAFFVAVVAARFWRIVCLALHFGFSSDKPGDALYHQRQAVLRNASNPEEGFWTICDLILAWRGTARKALARLLPPLVLAGGCVVIFTLAGGFSSSVQLSDGVGSEVLLTGRTCAQDYIRDDMTSYDYEALLYPYIAREYGESANYAQQCYNLHTGGILKCGTFVKQQISIQANYSAECPFTGAICKTNTSNIRLDTGYLDSHVHFGLNAPQGQRILVRKTLHCAPLVTTEGHKDVFNASSDRSYTRYYYGASVDFNFTSKEMIQENFTYRYTNDGRERAPNHLPGYTVGVQASFKRKGNVVLGSSFTPIPDLDVVNANVYVVFLSANQVRFAQQSADQWYTASTLAGARVNLNAEAHDMPVYWMDEVASPLGCVEQMQFCNPNVPESQGEEKRCTPMAGMFDVDDVSSLFSSSTTTNDGGDGDGDGDAKTRFSWVAKAVEGPSVSGLLLNLGAQSLRSRYFLRSGLQGPMPENQWQRDVEHWMSSILARDQAAFVRTATGPSDPAVSPFYRGPENATERSLCQNQKILSTEYASFSILGIVLTLAVGGLIVVVSMSLESFLAWFTRRFYGQMTYAQLEWCTNETLQLQRLVQEELGMGTWSGATKAVPTTKEPGQMLGLLDLRNREHPRMGRPVEDWEDGEVIMVGEEEGSGKGKGNEKPVLHHYNTDEITILGKVDSQFDLRTVNSSGSTMDWKHN